MKYFKLVPTIIMLFILLSSYKTADNNPLRTKISSDYKTSSIEEPIRGNVTKAIMFNGEIMPRIELPTIEITAPRSTKYFQKVIVIDGKVYPSVTLNEVVIKPSL